jgi:tRNA threonylcarbamoyladenosine biosynthesis protein TsaB
VSAASLLAIDTSTERLALGLQVGERCWTVAEEGGALASSRLLPQALALLRQAASRLQDLDAIAFARGPGAFTGLRTACAVAQGLAFGSGKPVLALDSLRLVAEDAHAAQGVDELWVAMDARMGEVYAAHYRRRDDAWITLVPPALYELDALLSRWRQAPPLAVAGSALAAFGARLPTFGALRVEREEDRAAALVRVAQSAWRAGEAVDAAQALPLYLRDKVALTTAEREARQAAEAPR